MKRYRLLILSLMMMASLAVAASSSVSLSSEQGAPRDTLTVTVDLNTTDAVSAVDITIPLGSYLKYAQNSVLLNTARSNGHYVSASQVGDNLRLIVYSLMLSPLNGQSGELLRFDLVLGKEPGVYALTPEVVLSNASGTTITSTTTSGSVTILAPKIALSTTSIDFGHIPIRSTYSHSVTISNTGTATLNVSDINFDDPELSCQQTCTIAAGASQSVTITYAPMTHGAATAKMTIASDAVNGLQKVNIVADPFSVNELHLLSTTGIADDTVEVFLKMNNMEAIVGMQASFPLPSALDVIPNSFNVNPRGVNHVAMTSIVNDTLTIMAYSLNNTPFVGNNDTLGSFKVRLNGSSGSYWLDPYDVVLPNTAGVNMVSASSGEYVNIASPEISVASQLDMGEISVTETGRAGLRVYNNSAVNLTVSRVTFLSEGYNVTNTFPMVLSSYDYDTIWVEHASQNEGTFSTTMQIYSNDPISRMTSVNVVGVAYEPNALKMSGSVNNGDYVLNVGLDNYSDIVALQMDIHWLDSMSTSSSALTLSARANGMLPILSKTSKGTYRLALFSLTNTPIAGHNGDLFQLVYNGNVNFNHSTITIDNIIASDKNGVNKNTVSSISMYISLQQLTVSCDTTMGRVTGGGLYSYGTTATVTAVANEHYHFVRWSNASSENPYSLLVAQDTTLTAIFAANPTYLFEETQTICQGDSYYWRSRVLTTPGIYYDSLKTTLDEDSVYQLTLSANPAYLFADSVREQDITFPYTWRGKIINGVGVYYDSLQTVVGCDSVYQLTVNPFVCVAPTNLVATLISNKSFQFDWVNPTLGTEDEQPNYFTYVLSATELDDPSTVKPTKAQRTTTMAQLTAALYNTEYHFYVKNVCNGRSSDWAHVAISSISGRPAVDSLHVIDTETRAITLSWKRSRFGKELKWKVDVALASDSSVVRTLVASTTSMRITGLDPETEYIFTVSPRLNSTNFGDPATVNGTTLDKPAMPVNVYGEITANRQVTFYWQNGSEADANNFSYKLSSKYIDMSKDKYSDNPDVEGFADTTVTFSNLSYGTTYYFYVRNVRATDGAASDWALCYVKTNLQNPPVKNIHAEDATPTTLTVAWERGNAASAEPRWIVVMRRESDNALIDSVNVNVMQATFTGLTRGTDYIARVYPRLNSKTLGTPASAVLSTEQTCEAPINLTYVNDAYRAYTFSWENPTIGTAEVEPNNFTYILVNSAEPINPDSTYPTKRNFTATSLSVTKLSKGATYYFYVRNEYDGAVSAWAGPIVITVPATASSAAHYGDDEEEENVEIIAENVVPAEAYVNYDKLFVENIAKGSNVTVIDASGRVVFNAKVNDTRMEYNLYVRGIYMVVIRGKQEQAIKVVY